MDNPTLLSNPSLWRDITLELNGKRIPAKVKANWTLLKVLREVVGLTGTKAGCDLSSCGSCTVLLEGNPIYSCSKLAIEVDGKRVTTIEGITGDGELHPVQTAFINEGAPQCGYCIPGFALTAAALLKQTPNPTLAQAKNFLAGNICRCCNYTKIIEAVLVASKLKM